MTPVAADIEVYPTSYCNVFFAIFSKICERISMMNRKLSFSLIFFIIQIVVWSQDKNLIINEIEITGNRITKEKIILRELTFQKGDTIPGDSFESLISRSRENILNTSIFNYVTITESTESTDLVTIIISVEERWYTWPSVILVYDDRNFSAWLKSKDFSKTKYGLSLDRFNAFGRRENLRASFLFGYARQFSASYKNIALDKNRKHFVGGDIEFIAQDEIIYATKENKPVTFNNDFKSAYDREKFTINYLFRPDIINYHNFYLNYFKYNIADTIIKLNPDFLGSNRNRFDCFTLDYVFSNDRRDIHAYPLRGSYFGLLIGQTLAKPFSKEPFSSTIIYPSFYKYMEINSKLFYAAGINIKLSYTNINSFIYSRSIGYKLNMHGFEYNTIEGQHFIILNNLLKFAVLKQRVTKISVIPFDKFNKIHYALYFNLFTDCGYVSNKYSTPDNDYANRFLYSGGVGFDLVTYYDRTFRIEYSINGSGIAGFYFHLTAPLNK